MAEAEATATAGTEATTNAPATTQDEAADSKTAPETKSGNTSTEDTSTDKGQSSGESSDNSNDTSGADSTGDQAEAADGSPAEKKENRIGYQLRQIRNNDSYVAGLRKNLQDDYVNEQGITPEEARLRRMEANDYVEKVERSRAELVTDQDKAVSEIDIFRPKNADGSDNPQFNAQLYERAMKRYARDQLVTEQDAEGREQIVGYKIPLLDYLREEADAYKAGVEQAKKTRSQDSKKAKAQMDANSETPGATSSSKSKSDDEDDPFLQGFNSVE